MEKVNNNFKCEKCNKIYTNASGIWKHNAKYHINDNNINHIEKTHIIHIKPKPSNDLCKYCNKKLCNSNSRWRHEKTCINKKDLKKENELYSETIENLKKENELQKETIKKLINRIEKLDIKKNTSIPLPLKRKVWSKWIGDKKGMSKCLCCKLTDISQMSFHCGHIISRNNGGDLNVNNLKPICQSCNSSMGSINMDVFIKQYSF